MSTQHPYNLLLHFAPMFRSYIPLLYFAPTWEQSILLHIKRTRS
jgi:hypothetical protein